MSDRPKTVGAISLGCDKNRVDTEKVLAYLSAAGYETVGSIPEADYIIINTCAFIKSATKESIDTVMECAAAKKEGAKILVLGCFTERYARETAEEFSEVDAFVGMNRYAEIVSILETLGSGERLYLGGTPAFYPPERVQTTPAHYAYLKIAEGCSNFCTYCAIPRIRGVYRSEPEDKILQEAGMLADNGVKELIVVAQDTTRYGTDRGDTNISSLLKKLAKLDFRKIRLMYAYPEAVSDELIETIAEEEKIVKYLDIPLQHISAGVLKRMNRRTSPEAIYALLEKLRKNIPDVAVRSTFIVGFPGETDSDFEELRRFIADGNIDYAGFFAYSKEEGTPAASMPGQIPYKLKKARERELSRLQCAVIQANHAKYLGKTVEVVYEGVNRAGTRFVGRSDFQAPGIDTKIYFTSDFPVEAGEYYDVEITRTGFDLGGKALRRKE